MWSRPGRLQEEEDGHTAPKASWERTSRLWRSTGTWACTDIFYQSVVASALFYAVVCWGGSIGAGNTNRLNKLIRKAGSVIGCNLDTLEAVVERRMLNKLLAILDNPDHPLHPLLDRQRSSFSNRLIQLHCHKDRYRKSFLPSAITLFNKSV
jgi:hypothetical protein